MKWLYLPLLLLLGCNDVKKVELKSGNLDSTKYDGMYFDNNNEVAGTFANKNFLLTICHYTRYDNYKDWWLNRYTIHKDEEYYKKQKNVKASGVVYYEIINLAAAFKPKKTGKLCCSKLTFDNGEKVTYYSDTTEKGFHFKVVRKPMSLKAENNWYGILLDKTVNSALDSSCQPRKNCFYGIYKEVLQVPYRIITDEEINDPETKIKNEKFMESINKLY